MKILRLTLKKKWFDMIASGEKNEEYREIKPYWLSRLTFLPNTWIKGVPPALDELYRNPDVIRYDFDAVEFKNGYAANAPTMLFECNGIDIGTAKPEWSDNWQGDVFRIKLGNRIKK